MRVDAWGTCLVLVLSLCPAAVRVLAAEEAPPAKTAATADLLEIADEPKTIDPATLMPAKLTGRATVDLSDVSLSEVVAWLRDQQELVVLLNRNALADAGVLLTEPVSDRLDDEPIYLLLDRLRALKLGWYYENDVLSITSADAVERRLATVPYNIGDLLDAGYQTDALYATIESTIAVSRWEAVGGSGSLTFLGDVMFVRQTDAIQREVQGLLAALREHGRRTFILDPPKHQMFRERLEQNVSVDFVDTPLETAVRQLTETTSVDIRLDLPALRSVRIREREPVTVRLAERKLKTVLQAMLMDLDLRWTLRDGVLWITTPEEVESFLKTAVYDVRDLSRDEDESDALIEAITSQTEMHAWDQVGGPGSICFAKSGTMVICNEERVLTNVLDLLETYRTALRASKPRERDAIDPNEVITVYYRMHANVGDDLAKLLKTLVASDSWKSDTQPNAPGQIVRAASAPEVTAIDSGLKGDGSVENTHALVMARAVLIITQTREVHDEIAEVIRRVESGDPPTGSKGMDDFGSMGGMGGFGGGFFSLPPERP